MRELRRGVLFLPLLCLGLCCALIMLALRFTAEQRDRKVAAALLYSDVRELAGDDGEAWLNTVGAAFLICTDAETPAARALAERCGMSQGRVGTTAQPGDAFLMPLSGGWTEGAPEAATPGGDAAVPLALTENHSRTGLVIPGGFAYDGWEGPIVKALYLYPDYAAPTGTETAAERAEGVLFRAALERSARLLVLRPLRDENGAYRTEPELYRDLLQSLSQSLARRGLTLGRELSCPAFPARSRWLLAGAALAAAMLFLALLRRFLHAPEKLPAWLPEALLGAAAAGGTLLLPDLAQRLLPLGAAALAGIFAGLWILHWTAAPPEKSLGAMERRFLLALGGLLAIAVGGGLYVAALMSSRRYLLGGGIFFGVKAAQLLPLAVTAALLLSRLLLRPRFRLQKRDIAQLLVCALLALLALAIALLRSGDNAALVFPAETRIRSWLEQSLYARPRTKEFLAAFPALALFLLALCRRAPLPALLLGLLAELGAVSVVNTFCHCFTPLRVSLIRTLLGGALGLVLGAAALALLWLLLSGAEKNKPAQTPS